MEEEKILIYNEENNYDTVVVENTDEIIYDETIQIVELDEPELYTVGTDEAFTPLGGQNEQLNHALLHNRDLPDQHTISSITGLRQELDDIEALKTVESDKRGSANYYMWKDEQSSLPADRTGYFVSIHTRDHKISICDSTTEIFGVTVGSAGFVGWQHYDEEDKPRDEKYALVSNTGVVKVRCWPSVVAGDYVMSANDGRARKTNNGHGYYVISIDDSDGIRHAVISLDSTMNQVYDLSQEVDAFNIRVDDVEIKTNAAINAATEALKQSFEAGLNSALKDSQDALDKAESALDKVTDLEDGLTSEMAGVKVQVDAIEDGIVIATQEAAQKAVDELIDDAITTNQEIEALRESVKKAQDTAQESLDETRGLANEITPLVEFNDGKYKGVAGVVASAENNTLQLAAISQCLSNDYVTIETWGNIYDKDTSQIYYVEDEGLYYYYDVETDQWLSTSEPSEAGLSEAIASIRQKADKDQAMVENLTSYSGTQYETIAKWNGYQKVYTWSQNIADPYIIYYEEATGLYWQCDINNLETPWSSSETAPRNDLEEKDTDKVYYAEDTERYYCYYDNGWHSTNSSTAKLAQSIALTKQTADANSAKIEEILSYSGPDSDTLASIRASVEENKAEIDSLTSYVQKNYTELDETWDETGKDQSVIYYAKDTDGTWKYWYWKEDTQIPTWIGSTNPADAGLPASIANINQKATNNEAKITALTNWQGTTNDAIAKLEQSVGEDGASLESLVMNISKYTVGKYSQAYGLTVEEAKELLRDGTVFVPNENTTESYEKEDGTYYERSFTKGYYYTWDKTNGIWVVSNMGGVVFTTEYINGNDTSPYMVVEADIDGYDFEVGALYYWNTDKENPYWQKVATLESNTLNRAISQMRQTQNSIESSVANVKGDLAGINTRVTDVEASVSSVATFDGRLSVVEQVADQNTASTSALAIGGIKVINTWDSSNPPDDTSQVYYDKTNKLYHFYYDNKQTWHSSDYVDYPEIAKRIKSAGLIAAINGDTSNVKISADKVSITAPEIDLSGYVTFSSLTSSGTTEIDGSRIKTGSIESFGYVDGSDGYSSVGTKINLSDGTITSQNLKIDGAGQVSLRGEFSTIRTETEIQITINGYGIRWADGDRSNGFVDSGISAMTTGDSDSAGLALGAKSFAFGYRYLDNSNEQFVHTLSLDHIFYENNPETSGGVGTPDDVFKKMCLYPVKNNSYLGTSDNKWSYIYGNNGYFNSLSSKNGSFDSLTVNQKNVATYLTEKDGSVNEYAFVIGDILICFGTLDVGTTGEVSVTFPETFYDNPHVVACAEGVSPKPVSVSYVDTTSCYIHCEYRSNQKVYYIAIGKHSA